MKRKTWLISAMGALALGLLMVPAQAAPVSGVTGGLKIAAGENAGVEKVHRRGYRHRHYKKRHRYHGYHSYRRYRHHGYRSYRRGPGIHFYFGHRRHRHHGYYGHW